ncbi:Putative 115 kDa protein in type-1 retrotransposable element R1DM [Anthophora quadrimaculata]
MDELSQFVGRSKTDILLVQEPYCPADKVCGLGLNTKLLSDKKKFAKISTAHKIKATIAIYNRNCDALKIEQLSNTHFICSEITLSNYKLFLVCAYLQHCEEIKPYLCHLDQILQTLRGKNIILCMDSNANSIVWDSKSTNDRGEKLEDLIAQHNLHVMNKKSNTYTFDNTHGQDNIDVTLTSNSLRNKVKNWRVSPNETTSDHNIITFEIDHEQPSGTNTKSNRFNLRRASWDEFRKHLTEEIKTAEKPSRTDPSEDAQELSKNLEDAIIKASELSIPKKTQFARSVPWWTRHLTELRQKSFEARHRYQRTKNEPHRQKQKKEYNKARNKYISAVRTAKAESWRKFVTQEGNSETWGIIYKIQTKNIRADIAYNSIRTGSTHTTTWEQTMETLLNTLIPNDNIEEEDPWHQSMRERSKVPPDTENAPPIEEQEITNIIRNLKTNKAPGQDLIENEIIKQAWPIIKQEITGLYNRCLEQGTFPVQWKKASIRILLKGEEKNESDPKSYRPISLLPVLGKFLEKIIHNRLYTLFQNHPLAATRQYGFRKGKSTEDAIMKLRKIVADTTEKYAIAILLDISGAFDHVWWPSILLNLQRRNCPKNIYTLIQSYLSERTAKIQGACNEVEKPVNRGCPQGSILGPQLWNLVFDETIDLIA